jgi:hypothetical protein
VKLVVLLAAFALACAGCGASSASNGLAEATPPVAKRLLTARLHAKSLTFRWVACIRTGRRFQGVRIVRCNVDFGDPHIEAYCSVLRNGRLVTDHDDPAIPCKHDDAGPSATIVHS